MFPPWIGSFGPAIFASGRAIALDGARLGASMPEYAPGRVTV
jgi:hypothetical protein